MAKTALNIESLGAFDVKIIEDEPEGPTDSREVHRASKPGASSTTGSGPTRYPGGMLNTVDLGNGRTSTFDTTRVSPAVIDLTIKLVLDGLRAKAPVPLPPELIFQMLSQEFSAQQLEDYAPEGYLGYSANISNVEGVLVFDVLNPLQWLTISSAFSYRKNSKIWEFLLATVAEQGKNHFLEPPAPWYIPFTHKGLQLYPECMIWLPKLDVAVGNVFMTLMNKSS